MTESTSTSGHRGAAAVIALVCLAVATVLMMVMAHRAYSEWKLVALEARQVQCRWLAESALERAAVRLASDPKYRGELWTIPASAFTGTEGSGQGVAGAVVRIEVSTPANQPLSRLVRVQADWPDEPQSRVRVSKVLMIELPPEPKGK